MAVLPPHPFINLAGIPLGACLNSIIIMNLFTIHRNCYATIDITVAADTREQALALAARRFDEIPADQYTFTENEVSIIDTQQAPDIDALLNAVKHRYNLDYEAGDALVLPHYVYIHISLLECDESGRTVDMVEHLNAVESIYLDEDDRIWVQYDSDCLDDLLEDLADEDIIAVLEAALL